MTAQYTPKKAIPLTVKQTFSQVMGKTYNPDKTLDVVHLIMSWFNLVNRFGNGYRVPSEAPDRIVHITLPAE